MFTEQKVTFLGNLEITLFLGRSIFKYIKYCQTPPSLEEKWKDKIYLASFRVGLCFHKDLAKIYAVSGLTRQLQYIIPS